MEGLIFPTVCAAGAVLVVLQRRQTKTLVGGTPLDKSARGTCSENVLSTLQKGQLSSGKPKPAATPCRVVKLPCETEATDAAAAAKAAATALAAAEAKAELEAKEATEAAAAAKETETHDDDLRRCTASVVTLPGEPLLGQDKWLGGVASPCGKYVYGVPGNAQDILRIDVATGKSSRMPLPAPRIGKFKWLRGVSVPPETCTLGGKYPSGIVIFCPSNADSALRVDPATQEVTHIGAPLKGTWKWHGGCLAADGHIYCIPCNAEHVLRINPGTSAVTRIGGPFKGKQKWYGGILAKNGAIYGIPHCATGVLKIVPSTQECTVFGQGLCGVEGGWKWHGGLATDDGTIIYGFPNNADRVLKIDTRTDTVTQIGRAGVLKSGRHRKVQDGKYKYLGGAVAADGNVYCFPCDAERVMRIDTRTDEVSTIGPELLEGENKWQNGFAGRDGCVYAIPQRSSGILRVQPSAGPGQEAEVTVLDCGKAFAKCKDKFEGGVMGSDNSIYCIPLRAKHACKVVVPEVISGPDHV